MFVKSSFRPPNPGEDARLMCKSCGFRFIAPLKIGLFQKNICPSCGSKKVTLDIFIQH